MEEKLERLDIESDGFEYYRLVRQAGFVKNSFIVRNQAFRDVLYSPQDAGITLQNKMKRAGSAFVHAVDEVVFKEEEVLRERVAEVVFLSGGIFYELNHGFCSEKKFSVPQCFLGIRRLKVEGTQGEFVAEADYTNFEALPDNACIVIGDTLATGATLYEGLLETGRIAKKQGKKIKMVIFCTLAGPIKGGRNFSRVIDELKKDFADLEAYFICAEQVFHLMNDGTDLRFEGPDAIVPESSREYTQNVLGGWLDKKNKCAVWDWGTRCKDPLAHWEEFEIYAKKMLDEAPDERSKTVLSSQLEQLREQRGVYDGRV